MLHIREFISNNKHLPWWDTTDLWNTAGDKTCRLSLIHIMTEGSGWAWDSPFNLFWLLMRGYQIPISLSCSLPSSAPCCSLEDCFGEHLEAGCWMGFILAGPCASASVLGAWMLGHGPWRRQSWKWGRGGGRNKREPAKTQQRTLDVIFLFIYFFSISVDYLLPCTKSTQNVPLASHYFFLSSICCLPFLISPQMKMEVK